MRALRPGEDYVHCARLCGGGSRQVHLGALVSHELHTSASVRSAAPIPPEEWGRTNLEWMQQHAHLARLCRRTAIPLTLLAQRTRTTTANAGSRSPHAGSHRLLGGAHAEATSGQRDTAASHPVGAQSPVLRSGPLSRANLPAGERSPQEEPYAVKEGSEQAQTQSCALAQAEADAPAPGADSRSID